MAQIVEFRGFTFKINPENRKELLIKTTTAKNFSSFKSIEATIHYLLSSKNLLVIFTEKGFYNSLNPLTGDWDILECKDYFFNKEICQHINLLR